ncbi:MAG: hypothetical protein RRX92_05470 [Lachnospiraceae bacterium]
MENEKLSVEQLVEEYKDDVHRLVPYIPWLESKVGQKVSGTYTEDGIEKCSIGVPTYDSTLLNFIKTVKTTKLISRNYAYAYARYRMKNSTDELRYIKQAKITELSLLNGILSKYVLRGMTKSTEWTTGVTEGIFLQVILKYKELIEYYEGRLL